MYAWICYDDIGFRFIQRLHRRTYKHNVGQRETFKMLVDLPVCGYAVDTIKYFDGNFLWNKYGLT